MKELKYLNKYLLKYKTNLLLGFFIIIIARILLLFTPGLIRNSVNVIDEFRKGDVTDIEIVQTELIENIFLILLAAISAGIFTFLTRQTIINVSRYVEFDLKNEIYNQYQKLSLSFYKKNQTGDLMNRISEDVSRVRMYVGPAIMYSTNTITLLVITFFYMYKQSPELTLYTVSPLPILSFTIYKLSRIINIKSKIVQESLSNLSSFSQEIFTGIKIVKSYSMQASNTDKFEEISQVNKENQVSLAKMQALFFPLMILLIGVSNIFVIYIGGKQYLNGSIESIGIIAEFIIYVNMLTWPVASLGWISSIVQQAEASQKRINEFLIEKSEIKNVENGVKKVNGKIEFKNIFFKYSDSNVQALNGISFLIKPKSSLGIIGVTGSGKTTALKLITRSYNISSGEILLDDHSLNKIDLIHLRENIGVVPQDSFLFSDTIINNIRFGNEKASKKEIEKVCEIAGIHKEILKFKDQYNTMLGERGVNLSGGQKQRVCIARALVKKPKILIMDDCLSALDTETEEKIIKSLNEYIKDTTTIISSHRISSIQNLDKIIVLNDGKIIQKGSHEELINENGYYKQLYFKQLTEKED
ncbi:MAG: ABC transporter ATP-binding protein/permease [Flavobacteriaceae bacterium]|nr:ABC transporter ATP-binding protein/permease [Flavobacteriaceae bacterium]